MTVPPKKLKALMNSNKQKGAPPFVKKDKGGGGDGGGGGGKKPKPPHKEPDGDEDEHGKEPGGDHSEADEAIVAKVAKELEEGDTSDSKIDDLMDDYKPDDGVPDWASSELWERAMKAVDPEGAGSEHDDPWRLVAYVYAEMGGQVLDGDDEEDDEDDESDDNGPPGGGDDNE